MSQRAPETHHSGGPRTKTFWINPRMILNQGFPACSQHTFRHFLLDKGRFFYLRWGVYEARKKAVQGEEAMERKVKGAPGNDTGPLNGAPTGKDYGA